jgi:phage/plasmid-like protein (TIGR03299 family)
MAHHIFDQRFYAHRKPAWHRLGYVSEEAHTAVEVGDLIGLPKVYERPIAAKGDQVYMPIPGYKAIVGVSQIEGKPKASTYAVVVDHYEVLTHEHFTHLFHQATGSRVETMGLLGDGETLFLTAPISTIDVRGDEVNNYLMTLNPLNGRAAIQTRTTSVRVVCANTLALALKEDTTRAFRIRHTQGKVAEQVEDWLRMTWSQTQGMTELLKGAYEAMARLHVIPDTVAETLETVYPIPDEPEHPTDAIRAAWEKGRETQQSHQHTVMELFEGSHTHTAATHGTAWGLWNSVVEYEDFARPRSNARSRVFGAGAERKAKAFDHLYAMTGQ